MKIAYDVDGTLIHKTYTGRDVPRHDILQSLFWFHSHSHSIIVWSGGGQDYAKDWAEKLGISHLVEILSKDEYHGVDICFDDEVVELAKMNIRV